MRLYSTSSHGAPGLPRDWYERTTIGGRRRQSVRPIAWFALRLLVGALIVLLALGIA